MSKMINEESLSMTIRKTTDNIEILMNGGMLQNLDDGTKISEIENIQISGAHYSLYEFSELVEYIEPMTEREVAQAKEIEELKAQLAARPTVSGKHRKEKTIYSSSDEAKIAGFWKAEKAIGSEITRKDMADMYNLSPNSVTRILVKFGVEKKKTNNVKVNAKIEDDNDE